MDVATTRLNRCLNPKSIAVIGGAEASRVITQCHKLGFAGDIFPVNPKRDSMQGLRCYPDIDALPEAPDAAFIAIPAEPTIGVVKALSQRDSGGAVCYASGFKETGKEGGDRHQRLLRAAAMMPIFGPNCYGFINLLSGAALWPDYHGAKRVEKGVAILSQSGNVSLSLSMQQRLLPIAWLVTLGNQAVVGFEEAILAALENSSITAIGIHIEGLNNIPLFAKVAERAKLRGIPLVVLKAGRSELGAHITFSHTATLAGKQLLYEELFERLGVGQTSTLEEFIEALKLVSISGVLSGNRIASMSCSGGEATLIADLSSSRTIEFPPLDEDHRKTVQATLNEYVHVSNPLDYHTFIWGDRERMLDTFSAMMAGNFNLTVLIIDTPSDDREATEIWLLAVHAFIDACRTTNTKGALISSLSESLPNEVGRIVIENKITPLHGIEQALIAIEVAYRISNAWSQRAAPLALRHVAGTSERMNTVLDEYQAKQLLACTGLSTPPSIVVESVEAAAVAAEQLGYPVVLKGLSSGIAHKTELGLVEVNLKKSGQVAKHAKRMFTTSDRLLVEKMITGGVVELLLGISTDQQFGHYLIIGFGGTWVELFEDRQLLLLPVDKEMIRRALNRLKIAPLLNGYRGHPPADVDAVIECALRLTQLIEHERNDIVEIEINPIIVKPKNQGAVVADALITRQNVIK